MSPQVFSYNPGGSCPILLGIGFIPSEACPNLTRGKHPLQAGIQVSPGFYKPMII
jgi:hypothetical protein